VSLSRWERAPRHRNLARRLVCRELGSLQKTQPARVRRNIVPIVVVSWLATDTTSTAGLPGVYGYGRNSQEFFGVGGLSRIQANVHQATGGLVFSLPAPARFRIHPYVLAEGGALVFDPTGNTFGTVPGAQKQTVGVFAYGGGADFPLVNHVSLRAEYRGLVYGAPDFGLRQLNTNTTTHTVQPSAGIVFRF
jgi:opacity protein-like surface antigen